MSSLFSTLDRWLQALAEERGEDRWRTDTAPGCIDGVIFKKNHGDSNSQFMDCVNCVSGFKVFFSSIRRFLWGSYGCFTEFMNIWVIFNRETADLAHSIFWLGRFFFDLTQRPISWKRKQDVEMLQCYSTKKFSETIGDSWSFNQHQIFSRHGARLLPKLRFSIQDSGHCLCCGRP